MPLLTKFYDKTDLISIYKILYETDDDSEASYYIEQILNQQVGSHYKNWYELINISDDFSEEYDKAIEQKQVVEQQTKTSQLELEKAKIDNEKKIENAKTEAEVMKQQNAQITEQTLKLKELEIKQKLIEKWNGSFPATMLSDDINTLFNIGN